MKRSLNKMTNVYGIKIKTLYPDEYLKDEKSYNNILDNLLLKDIRSSLTNKLPL